MKRTYCCALSHLSLITGGCENIFVKNFSDQVTAGLNKTQPPVGIVRQVLDKNSVYRITKWGNCANLNRKCNCLTIRNHALLSEPQCMSLYRKSSINDVASDLPIYLYLLSSV